MNLEKKSLSVWGFLAFWGFFVVFFFPVIHSHWHITAEEQASAEMRTLVCHYLNGHKVLSFTQSNFLLQSFSEDLSCLHRFAILVLLTSAEL